MCFFTQAQVTEVTYLGVDDALAKYNDELLAEAFKHSGTSMPSIKRYPEGTPHHRGFIALGQNQGLDIVIGYATQERNDKYLAIPIPLLKGLNGWRLPVVHQDNVNIFKNIDTLAAFKEFRPGLYHSWTDYKILKHNDFSIVRGSDYQGLFQMLNKKRFDYFPRSIMVAASEVEMFIETKNLKLALDPYILIHYPTASYFYVNKQNTALAQTLTLGLERMIKNGKFDQLFERHFGELVKTIKAQNRKVFRLDNPLLPVTVPVNRKELWIEP